MSNFGVKKRAPKSEGTEKSYECTYYKVRTEHPQTEEVMPSFVPVEKLDGKYTEDWGEAAQEVVGTIIGVEPRTYEYNRKGKTRMGFELRVFMDFGVNSYARLDFGKSGMLNALMNAVAGGLIGKPVRLFLWTSNEGYANISIKHYEDGVSVGDMKRVDMSMSFRDFYDQYGKDSESLFKFAEEAIIPLQEKSFNIDNPFGLSKKENSGVNNIAPISEITSETAELNADITDDLPF